MLNNRSKFKILHDLKDFFFLTPEQKKLKKKWQKAHDLMLEKKFKESFTLWEEITIECPRDYAAYVMWGLAYEGEVTFNNNSKELLENAYDQYLKAISLKPELSDAYHRYAHTLMLEASLDADEASSLCEQACRMYQKAYSAIGGDYENLCFWGSALLKRADLEKSRTKELLQEVCIKCKKAIEIKTDGRAAYVNWSAAIIGLSQINNDKEAELLGEAEEVALKAESLEKGGGAYNLACIFALRDNEDECKKWLRVSEEVGELGTLKEATEDPDLCSVKDKSWFKELKWECEK